MADHSLEEAEVCLHPLLSLCHVRGAVTALVLVQTGVGVSQGLEPPLKVLDRLPHGLALILQELCLLVHPPVVSFLDVPEDGVLAKEIAHELLLLDIKKTDYRRVDKKAKLWEDQDKAMGKTVEHLQGWFKSLRDTHTRLTQFLLLRLPLLLLALLARNWYSVKSMRSC